MPQIDGFLWDDRCEAKVWAHGLSPVEVDSILDGDFLVRRNRKARRGPFQMIGRSRGGRVITVIIEPTTTSPLLWRPITAWPSKPSEARYLRNG